VDTNEGGFYWDATRPVAITKAEFVQMRLNETVKIFFPQWSYDEWLDYHAELCGLTRKPAVKATGTLQLIGTVGKTIAAGAQFAVPSINGQAAVIFNTTADVTLNGGGTGSVAIGAAEGGTSGNVSANTITIMVQPVPEIKSIANAAATTGGIDIENDDSLLERILAVNQGAVGSGTKTDYETWAKEVPGCGDAFCVPLENGNGTVSVYILDTNGSPADQGLIDDVVAYICPADGSGKAPIGANVSILPVAAHNLTYSMHAVPAAGYTAAQVQANILAKLAEYYKVVGIGGLFKYSFAWQKIAEAEGLDDLSGLTINGGTSNVQIPAGKFPATGTVTWT
jgi:uncharacterized phage protein gp47/JayE